MQNRKYGATKVVSIQEIKRGLSSLPYVKTAFLFGSHANGTADTKSDYDFALEMKNLPQEEWGMQAKAWMDVCAIFGLREYDVDIVDISLADIYLKQAIFQNHILLKGSVNDISRLLN